jgi:hypothetical protein
VKPCFGARSIESSEFGGFDDVYAIVGCSRPPASNILDGETSDPLKMVAISGHERGAGNHVAEARYVQRPRHRLRRVLGPEGHSSRSRRG